MKTLALSTFTTLILTACGQSLPSGLNANSANQASTGVSTTTLPSSGATGSSATSTSASTTGSTTSSNSNVVITSGTSIKDSSGAALINGQSYFLQNASTSDCLDVTGVATTDGAVVQPYQCLTSQPNQQWTVHLATNGSMTLTSVNDNLCLDNALDGSGFQQWDCLGNPNQGFSFNAVSGGYQISSLDRTTSCVTDNGSAIVNATCGSVGGQTYRFVPAAQAF